MVGDSAQKCGESNLNSQPSDLESDAPWEPCSRLILGRFHKGGKPMADPCWRQQADLWGGAVKRTRTPSARTRRPVCGRRQTDAAGPVKRTRRPSPGARQTDAHTQEVRRREEGRRRRGEEKDERRRITALRHAKNHVVNHQPSYQLVS